MEISDIFKKSYIDKLVNWEIEGSKNTYLCYYIIDCIENKKEEIFISRTDDEEINNWINGYCKSQGCKLNKY